jgi:hypothetical protein
MTDQGTPPEDPVPYIPYDSPTPLAPGEKPPWLAITSFILGILSLCAWVIPLCGCPVHVGGIIFGILGLKSRYRTLAIIGIILCSLAFILTVINAAWGAYLGATGRHPLVPFK